MRDATQKILDVQRELLEKRLYLTSADVINAITEQQNLLRFEDLGLGSPEQVPALRQLLRTEARIEDVFKSLLKRGFVTFHEFQQQVLSQERVRGSNLAVGLLSANPRWQEAFKLPSATGWVPVTACEVYSALYLVLERRGGMTAKSDTQTHQEAAAMLEDVLNAVAESMKAKKETLGIIINSIELALKSQIPIAVTTGECVERFFINRRNEIEAGVKRLVSASLQAPEGQMQGSLVHKDKAKGLDYLRSQAALVVNIDQDEEVTDPLTLLTTSQTAALREQFKLPPNLTFEALLQVLLTSCRVVTNSHGAGALDDGDTARVVQRLIHLISTSFAGCISTAPTNQRTFWTQDFVALTLVHMLAAALQQQGTNDLPAPYSSGKKDESDSEAGDTCFARDARRLARHIKVLYDAITAHKPASQWNPDYVKRLKDAVQADINIPPVKLKAMSTLISFLLKDSSRAEGEEQAAGRKQGQQASAPGAVVAAASALAADAPATYRKPAGVTHARLQEAVGRLNTGCSIAALAQLESALVKEFNASTFSDLGHGPSLLAALDHDCELLAAVVGAGESSGAVVAAPWGHVLDIAAQALQALGTDAGADAAMAADLRCAAVSTALCQQYGVRDVLQLGHGPLAHIVDRALEAASRPRVNVRSVPALSVSHNPAAVETPRVLGLATLDMATACLNAAPMLTDLAQCCQWGLTFEASLGSLRDWLHEKGLGAGVTILELPGGALVKVPGAATVEEFAACASRGDALGAVQALLSLVAQAGGAAQAPLALLAAAMEPCLLALAAQAGHRDDSEMANPQGAVTGAAGAGEAARFILRCLMHVPQPLLPSIAPAALLQPLSSLLGASQAAERTLLANCSSAAERSVLHHLGLVLGLELWRDDFLELCRGAGTGQAMQGPEIIDLTEAGTPQASNRPAPSLDPLQLLLAEQPATRDAAMDDAKPRDELPDAAVATSSSAGTPARATAGLTEQCRLVVEAIRREEFGLNVELKGEALQVWQRQNQRMGRALQRLSQELYSKDTHFVLELVQNADDNSYPAGVVPALEFVLHSDSIEVLNNERGFSETNIRALCDVGRSTKLKAVGYIGQKGIGFKSVFRISDSPQIHSNGFHITFDLGRHQSLGYILPTWLEMPAPLAPACSLPSLQDAKTRIILPLQAKLKGEAGLVLRQKFEDVHPTLLLFLHKLQCIAVTDAVTGQRAIMMKRQLPGGVVELRSGPRADAITKWLMVSSKFKPSVPRGELRLDESEVSLAFNLDGPAPSQQQVFAYLPLRSYGLRFVVQADFVVPSSREAVDCDNAWNQMLRAQVPGLFLQALEVFRALPAPAGRPHYWTDRWLRCIPVEGEAQGFFAALPHAIAARLRAAACIPTEDGHLVTPDAAMVCTSPAIRRLVSGQQLQQLLGLRFTHHDLEALNSSAPLRQLLGIPEFDPAQVVDLLKGLCEKGQLHSMGLPWLAAVLATIFEEEETGGAGGQSAARSMARMRSQITRDLRQLRILPLNRGGSVFVSLEESSPVFFPADVSEYESQATRPGGQPGAGDSPTAHQSGQQLLRSMHVCHMRQDLLRLSLLDPLLITALPEERRVHLIQGLRHLGVRDLSAQDVMSMHILPALRSPSILTSDPVLCIAYLAFPLLTGLLNGAPVEQDVGPPVLLKQLQECAVLVLRGERIVRLGSMQPYLPQNMGAEYQLLKSFPNYDWHVISDQYATHHAGLRALWLWLFKHLGALPLPCSVPRTFTTTAAALSSTPFWRHLQLDTEVAPEAGQQEWLIEDMVCVDFEPLVERIKQTAQEGHVLEKLRCVADMMNKNWTAHYASGMKARCRPSVGPSGVEPPWQEVPSSFALALRETAWMPASDGCILPPVGLFLDGGPIYTLFSTGVVYVRAPVSHPDMLAALGVVSKPSVDVTLGVLRRWAQQSPAPAELSLQQMGQVYQYLAREVATSAELQHKVSSAFAEHPLVWLPDKADRDSEAGGCMLPITTMRMHDRTGVAELVPATPDFQWRVLGGFYPALTQFFGNHLITQDSQTLVAAQPTLSDYCALLAAIVAQPLDFKSKHPQVLALLSMWADMLQEGALSEQDVAALASWLRTGPPCVPTSAGMFMQLSDSMYIDDDPQLSQLFRSGQDIGFIHLSSVTASGQQQQRQRTQDLAASPMAQLFKALGVPTFSQCIKRQLHIGAEPQEQMLMPRLLMAAPPYVQRYLYHTLATEEYNAVAAEVGAAIAVLQVVVVEQLDLTLALPRQTERSDNTLSVTIKADAALQTSTLYLTVAAATAPLLGSICPEYSRFFNHGLVSFGVSSFLYSLLHSLQDNLGAVEDYMEHCGALALPDGEEVWKSAVDVFTLYDMPDVEQAEPGSDTALPDPSTTVPPLAAVGQLTLGKRLRQPDTQEHGDDDDDEDPRKRTRLDHGRPPQNQQLSLPAGPPGVQPQQGHPLGGSRLPDTRGGPNRQVDTGSQSRPQAYTGRKQGPWRGNGWVPRLDPASAAASATEIQPSAELLNKVAPVLSQLPQSHAAEERAKLVGRYGEELVYHYIRNLPAHQHDVVEWVNEHVESGLPYDILIKRSEGSEVYVEVKSSYLERKEHFQISFPELRHAAAQGPAYHVYRVNGIGSGQESITVAVDPIRLWQGKRISVHMMLGNTFPA